MKGVAFLRAVCMALICGILLCFAACSAPAPTQGNQQVRLEVVSIPVTYTQEFCDDITPRAAELLFRLIRLWGGPQVSDAERKEAHARIQREMLTTALRASITAQELEQILSFVQNYCDEIELGEAGKADFVAFCRLYQRVVALIGTTRAGILSYDGCRQYLSARQVLCQQRYAEYGYSWYLEDAEMYRARLAALEGELSEQVLSQALGVFVMMGSFVTGFLPAETSQKNALILDGELLQILQMQADKFATLSVTSHQWGIMADILSDVCPKSADTALLSQLDVLQKSGTSVRITQTMPTFLPLYRSVIYKLGEQDIALLRSDAPQTQKDTLLCRAMSACAEEFLTFSAQLEVALQTNGADEERALKRLGLLEDFSRFCDATASLDASSLLAYLSYYGGEDPAALQNACISYLFGLSRYLAYAVSVELVKE